MRPANICEVPEVVHDEPGPGKSQLRRRLGPRRGNPHAQGAGGLTGTSLKDIESTKVSRDDNLRREIGRTAGSETGRDGGGWVAGWQKLGCHSAGAGRRTG